MRRLLCQLNAIAFFVLRLVLLAFRPRVLVPFGLAGGALCLVIGEVSPSAVAAAATFLLVALLGLWWGWHNWRRGPPPPAIISARIVEAEGDDD
jgi:hypothetical protein